MTKSATLEMAPEALRQFAEAMGMSTEAMEEFVGSVDKAARAMTSDPRKELLFRLNARQAGEDPGEPFNTGADGWRV